MIELELVVGSHDWLTPLLPGPVEVGPFRVSFDRTSGIARVASDPSVAGGEGSLAAHLRRVPSGDKTFVAVPIFMVRRFRHRSFLVFQSSQLTGLGDLVGKRVGIANWGTTGNTWSREALREAGVDSTAVRWVLEGTEPGSNLPPTAERRTGTGLEWLAAGEVDALISGDPFVPLRRELPSLRHLCTDFVEAEGAYYQRTGVFPAHHILLLRREFWARWPECLHSLYSLLAGARREWYESRWRMADEDAPWGSSDVERSSDTFHGTWYRDGLNFEGNVRTVAALSEQQYREGLSERPVTAQQAFEEFLQT
jgi:4,5-dihydroxyphthalate decarboxylase